MVRRFLPLLALVALGCGGAGTIEPSPETPRDLPQLGTSDLNLTIAGETQWSNTIQGTGTATGQLSIIDAKPDEESTTTVSATLYLNLPDQNLLQSQILYFKIAHPQALAVGDKFTIDNDTNRGQYQELRSWVEGPTAGDGYGNSWTAFGGTVEVTARSGSAITFKLTELTLQAFTPDNTKTMAISGTIAGSLTTFP